jgi:hypothetical protein
LFFCFFDASGKKTRPTESPFCWLFSNGDCEDLFLLSADWNLDAMA